jgi:hypothetical protein
MTTPQEITNVKEQLVKMTLEEKRISTPSPIKIDLRVRPISSPSPSKIEKSSNILTSPIIQKRKEKEQIDEHFSQLLDIKQTPSTVTPESNITFTLLNSGPAEIKF